MTLLSIAVSSFCIATMLHETHHPAGYPGFEDVGFLTSLM